MPQSPTKPPPKKSKSSAPPVPSPRFLSGDKIHINTGTFTISFLRDGQPIPIEEDKMPAMDILQSFLARFERPQIDSFVNLIADVVGCTAHVPQSDATSMTYELSEHRSLSFDEEPTQLLLYDELRFENRKVVLRRNGKPIHRNGKPAAYRIPIKNMQQLRQIAIVVAMAARLPCLEDFSNGAEDISFVFSPTE
jgi:hypothetical protein